MAKAAGTTSAWRAATMVSAAVLLAACGPEWEDGSGTSTEVTAEVLAEEPDVPTTRRPVEIPLTTQPRVATTEAASVLPASVAPTSDSAVTTAAPSTPAADTPPAADGPTGEFATVCGFVEPDPSVVPLAVSCGQGYLLTSYYRPAGAAYGARLWGLEGNVWVLRAKYETGCPRAPELASKGLPASLAEAWGSETGCRTAAEPFPFADVLAVPQLGAEPVRGSGCGADGGLGDRLPDGTWSVRAAQTNGEIMDVDVTCVFFGDEALARSAAAGLPPNSFWYEVNGSDRLRSVPMGPRFQLRYASRGEIDATCVDSGRPARFSESTVWTEVPSWLVVREGVAQLLLVTCPIF